MHELRRGALSKWQWHMPKFKKRNELHRPKVGIFDHDAVQQGRKYATLPDFFEGKRDAVVQRTEQPRQQCRNAGSGYCERQVFRSSKIEEPIALNI